MNTDDRYQIGHPVEGQVDRAGKLVDALQIAEHWATSPGCYPNALRDVSVYDCMAHRGAPREWKYVDGQWVVVKRASR